MKIQSIKILEGKCIKQISIENITNEPSDAYVDKIVVYFNDGTRTEIIGTDIKIEMY